MKVTKKKLIDFTGGDAIKFMILLGFLKGVDHAVTRQINRQIGKRMVHRADEDRPSAAAIRDLVEYQTDKIYVVPDGTRLFTLDDEGYLVYTDAPTGKNFNDLTSDELRDLINSRRKTRR